MNDTERRELLVEEICRVVESVPAGYATTYGAVAKVVGCGPRQVGKIIQETGGALPWWRLVNAKGQLPAPLTQAAVTHWENEGTPLRNTSHAGVDANGLIGPDELRVLAAASLRELAEWGAKNGYA